ncbi:MAG TPA: PAS domain-containing sensor histidine kinase [Bdellovibrionota bacterium]|jgi:nitrogen-specific signal transduction histidine kinase|nr:PAS domain-containing sensor histidine kinase [Bdellovibrionota bacterium]
MQILRPEVLSHELERNFTHYEKSEIRIALLSLDHEVLFANAAFRRDLCPKSENAVGLGFLQMLEEESQRKHLELCQHLSDIEIVAEAIEVRSTRDATATWFMVLALVHDVSGAPLYYRAFLRDPLQAADYLKDHHSDRDSHVARALVCAVNAEGVFTKMQGLLAENLMPSILGEHYRDVYAGAPETIARIERAMGGESFDVEVHFSGHWYHIWYKPLRDENLQISGASWTALPITKQKTTQAKLKNDIAQREEALSLASHEIRSPLSALSLQMKIMERTHALRDPSLNQFIKIGLRQVDTISTLVEKTLEAARIHDQGLGLEIQSSNLCDIIDGAVEQAQARFENRPCDIKIDYPPSLLGKWDPFRMGQVFENLITNALKYGNGSPIQISLRSDASQVTIEVQDQGPGISLDDQTKIFERYQRIGDNRNTHGYGLGLYIVKKIVEAHRGNIRVRSAPGEGSTFVVELPRSCN